MKSTLTGAIVAAAALLMSAAGAQTFDQSVNDALKNDGAVISQVQVQKQISAQDPEKIEAQQHGGGEHGGGRGPGRGPGHEPGRGEPGRGEPGHGGHEGPGRGEGHGPVWHGHEGGWGDHYHGHYGWHWDAWNRPLWLGWVVWGGIGSCREYYLGRRSGCYADCGAELNSCLASGADVGLCNATSVSCTASCNYQYDTVWAPYWGACRF